MMLYMFTSTALVLFFHIERTNIIKIKLVKRYLAYKIIIWLDMNRSVAEKQKAWREEASMDDIAKKQRHSLWINYDSKERESEVNLLTPLRSVWKV